MEITSLAIMMSIFGIIMFIIGAPIVLSEDVKSTDPIYKAALVNLMLGISFLLISGFILAYETDWYLSLLMILSTGIMIAFIFLGATTYYVLGAREGANTAFKFLTIGLIFATISITLTAGGIEGERGSEILGFS